MKKGMMCAVSAVMDHYWAKWQPLSPDYWGIPVANNAPIIPWTTPVITAPPVAAITDAEVEEFRRLLERAREYDHRTNQPDCETFAKKARIQKLADDLGVKVDFL